MNDKVAAVRDLLREAGEPTKVFRILDGVDGDWRRGTRSG